MDPQLSTTAEGKFGRFKRLAGNFGVSAIAGLLMSGLVSSWFATRLENNKEQVSSIIKQKDQVDTSQNNIFMQLGLYTNQVLSNGDASKQDDLRGAIITAQLQINRLRELLKDDDQKVLTAYSEELDNLQKHLRTIQKPNDLKPIFVSAQKLLALHDKASEAVRGNLKISVF